MAETKQILQREYIIPLRREWMKAARYKRARKSVMAIKKFIARHMKVADRNLKNVRLDTYLNNEIWFRGAKKPPAKIKVMAKKEGEIVRVELAEIPETVKFAMQKHVRRHFKSEKKKQEVKEQKSESKEAQEKSEEDKKKEIEKEKSVEIQHEKLAEKAAKAQKHTIKSDKGSQIHRKALKK